MSRTRGHNGRPSIRMPAVLRVARKSNVWSDWPHCGPAPGRGLRPFVRAAKHAEKHAHKHEIQDGIEAWWQEDGSGDECDGSCLACRGYVDGSVDLGVKIESFFAPVARTG